MLLSRHLLECHYDLCHYGEYCNAESHFHEFFIYCVIFLNADMLIDIFLSVIMQNVILLIVTFLNAIMLTILMLSVIILGAVMLSASAPYTNNLSEAAKTFLFEFNLKPTFFP
jgi:hypothetical protein